MSRIGAFLAAGLGVAAALTGVDPRAAEAGRGGIAGDAATLLRNFTAEEALDFAQLAAAAFCEGIETAWDCVPCLRTSEVKDVRRADDPGIDAHAYIGRFRGACVVAFRGTKTSKAWMQDVKSLRLVEWPSCTHGGSTCMVGAGFLEYYSRLRGALLEHLAADNCTSGAPVAVAGHSLGGAVATLAALDFQQLGYNVVGGYTFGQPRVGDGTFASAFREALGAVPLFRVTQFDDPVPLMPARGYFEHVGTEVYFWDRTTFQTCQGPEDPLCSVKHEGTILFSIVKCALSRDTCGHRSYFLHARPLLSGC